MHNKVLIANRGEIACRIVRTARRLGITSIAVASEADADAIHMKMADEAHIIGPASAHESYLNIPRLLDLAIASGADAIHPGYGFLSENAEFAASCIKAGLCFVGPSPETMRRMGSKNEAKIIAQAAGVPIVPGYTGSADDDARLLAEAARIGLPIIIKAVAGGGGRGMRQVNSAEELAFAIESARREAQTAFGDGRLMLERLILDPRHVEVQVFGDRNGNVVHLFERDCSLQRRHQKVVEEAPAPGMTDKLRERMTKAAVALAKSVGYEGAGTVEFLLEGCESGDQAGFFFIEMNTRLQVEHPVTEMVTGIDLVEWQFRVAAGQPLPLDQEEISLDGHAVEVRLYAEDPARDFQPSSSKLYDCRLPTGPGMRVDTGVRSGDQISPFYDPMIAKLIAHGPDRGAAFERMAAGLSETVILGPQTNAAFLHALVRRPEVLAGEVHTGLVGQKIEEMASSKPDYKAAAIGVGVLLKQQLVGEAIGMPSVEPWAKCDAFQLGGERCVPRPVFIEGEENSADLIWRDSELFVGLDSESHSANFPSDRGVACHALEDGSRVMIWHGLRQTVVAWPNYALLGNASGPAAGDVLAPIAGRVAALHISAGERVREGAPIAVIEAMKMEHVLTAGLDGVVSEISVAVSDQVTEGQLLARVSTNDEGT